MDYDKSNISSLAVNIHERELKTNREVLLIPANDEPNWLKGYL